MSKKRYRHDKQSGRGPVPPPERQSVRNISVSFENFNLREPFVFPAPADRPDDVRVLAERLRDLCRMTATEARNNRSVALRSHPIRWADTSKPGGFDHLNETMREQVMPWQFSLSENEYGRIHGFWAENVFHLVWIDPDHALYS